MGPPTPEDIVPLEAPIPSATAGRGKPAGPSRPKSTQAPPPPDSWQNVPPVAPAELSLAAGETLDAELLRRWAVVDMCRRVRAGTWGYLGGAILLGSLGMGTLPSSLCAGLAVWIAVLVVLREIHVGRFAEQYPRNAVAWRRIFFGLLLAIAGSLGAFAGLLLARSPIERSVLTLLILAGLSLGVVATFATRPRVVSAAVAAIALPAMVGAWVAPLEVTARRLEVAAILVYTAYLFVTSRRIDRSARESYVSRHLAERRKEDLEKARRELEEANESLRRHLEARTRSYRSVFEGAHEIILILDPETETVLDANPWAARSYGMALDELIGRSMRDLSVEPEVDRVGETRAAAPGFHRFETRQRGAGGTVLDLEVHASMIEFQGRPAILSLNRDVGQRRAAEKLRIAKEAAEEASRAKSMFLASMSHEMRSPLTVVVGMAELLMHEDLREEPRRKVEAIGEAARGLRTLIDDVLDLARAEQGGVAVRPRPVELEGVVRRIETWFRGRAGDGAALQVEIASGTPRLLLTDPDRLQQVLVNLLDNAFKFAPGGRILLRAEPDEVGGRSAVRFAVVDEGPGIAPDDQERIFDSFVRSNGAVAARIEGTGLGLAISRQLVEKLGGKLELDSRPGEGARFHFPLPVGTAGEAREPAAASTARWTATVLVVDDEASTREVLRLLAEDLGCRALEASGGEEALAVLDSHRVDLVLMDCDMPPPDGLETTRRLRQREAWAELPVLAVSASAFPEDRERALAAGMSEFLAKPCDRPTLAGAFERWLGAAGPSDGGSRGH